MLLTVFAAFILSYFATAKSESRCIFNHECEGLIPFATDTECDSGTCKALSCDEKLGFILFIDSSQKQICVSEWESISSIYKGYFGLDLPKEETCGTKCHSDHGLMLWEGHVVVIKWEFKPRAHPTKETSKLDRNLFFFDRLLYLVLNGIELQGEIPSEIGNLLSLTTLHLVGNKLTGSIPEEIGKLTKLSVMNLSENQLTGNIPKDIGHLGDLTNLDLNNNLIKGKIPEEIGFLSKLDSLHLADNKLTGKIPTEIGKLEHLVLISLSGNKNLKGEIPQSFKFLKKLEFLFLHNTKLTGTLPQMKLWYTENSCVLPASLTPECLGTNCIIVFESPIPFKTFPSCSIFNEECYMTREYEPDTRPCQQPYECVPESGEKYGKGVCQVVVHGDTVCDDSGCSLVCDEGYVVQNNVCKPISFREEHNENMLTFQ